MIKAKLAIAEEVHSFLNDDNFTDNWKQLADKSVGFTPLQKIEFVGIWYKIYTQYEPVMAIAYNEDGELVGLMCLAFHVKDRFITHAGHNDAEYHGWLAIPELSSDFLTSSVDLIKNRFAIKKWEWGWMPPGFTAELFEGVRNRGIGVTVEDAPAPIWNLTDHEKLRGLQKSRSLRSKFNRYKKRGDYRIERITNPERTAEVLKIVSVQCDLRQAAINDSRPFEEDSNRIKFCTALQTCQGLLHVSAIWLDNQLLAFHLGISDEKRVCLGLSSYDPSESKQSPGTLLLIELAKVLTDEGYEIFDLTPGKDMYKQRFANGHQLLCKPSITFTTRAKYIGKIKNGIRRAVMSFLPLFKTNIYSFHKWKNKVLEDLKRIKGLKIPEMFERLKNGLFTKKIFYVYFLDKVVLGTETVSNLKIGQQQYESLMVYRGEMPLLTKRKFLQESLHKFSFGQKLLSVTQKERLDWLAWLADTKKPIKLRGVAQSLPIEEGSHVLYDFYHSNKPEDDKGFFEYLKNTLNQLDFTDVSGLNVCLESKNQLSKDQIAFLRISSVKKVVFTNFIGTHKKVGITEITVC